MSDICDHYDSVLHFKLENYEWTKHDTISVKIQMCEHYKE